MKGLSHDFLHRKNKTVVPCELKIQYGTLRQYRGQRPDILWEVHIGFADCLLASSQQNLYDIYLLLCIQKTCVKHVEFYCKNTFEKLVHLVGFIIRMMHGPLNVKSLRPHQIRGWVGTEPVWTFPRREKCLLHASNHPTIPWLFRPQHSHTNYTTVALIHSFFMEILELIKLLFCYLFSVSQHMVQFYDQQMRESSWPW